MGGGGAARPSGCASLYPPPNYSAVLGWRSGACSRRLRVPWLARSPSTRWVITYSARVRRRLVRRVPARRWVRFASPCRLRASPLPSPPPSAALRPRPSASLRGGVITLRPRAPRGARGVPTFLQGLPPSPRPCVPLIRYPFSFAGVLPPPPAWGLCPPSPSVFFMVLSGFARYFFLNNPNVSAPWRHPFVGNFRVNPYQPPTTLGLSPSFVRLRFFCTFADVTECPFPDWEVPSSINTLLLWQKVICYSATPAVKWAHSFSLAQQVSR